GPPVRRRVPVAKPNSPAPADRSGSATATVWDVPGEPQTTASAPAKPAIQDSRQGEAKSSAWPDVRALAGPALAGRPPVSTTPSVTRLRETGIRDETAPPYAVCRMVSVGGGVVAVGSGVSVTSGSCEACRSSGVGEGSVGCGLGVGVAVSVGSGVTVGKGDGVRLGVGVGFTARMTDTCM